MPDTTASTANSISATASTQAQSQQPKSPLFGGSAAVFENLDKFEQISNPVGEPNFDFQFEDITLDEPKQEEKSDFSSDFSVPSTVTETPFVEPTFVVEQAASQPKFEQSTDQISEVDFSDQTPSAEFIPPQDVVEVQEVSVSEQVSTPEELAPPQDIVDSELVPQMQESEDDFEKTFVQVPYRSAEISSEYNDHSELTISEQGDNADRAVEEPMGNDPMEEAIELLPTAFESDLSGSEEFQKESVVSEVENKLDTSYEHSVSEFSVEENEQSKILFDVPLAENSEVTVELPESSEIELGASEITVDLPEDSENDIENSEISVDLPEDSENDIENSEITVDLPEDSENELENSEISVDLPESSEIELGDSEITVDLPEDSENDIENGEISVDLPEASESELENSEITVDLPESSENGQSAPNPEPVPSATPDLIAYQALEYEPRPELSKLMNKYQKLLMFAQDILHLQSKLGQSTSTFEIIGANTTKSQISYFVSLENIEQKSHLHIQRVEKMLDDDSQTDHLLTMTSETPDSNLQLFIDKELLYTEEKDLQEGNKLIFVSEKLNKFDFFFTDKQKEFAQQRLAIKQEKEKQAGLRAIFRSF